MMKKLISIAALFLLLFNPVHSQEKSYFGLCTDMAIGFYRQFLSPVRSPVSSCRFTPSCSEYGRLSVHKYGIVPGIVMTADRLTRCSGSRASADDYLIVDGLGYDPPGGYHPVPALMCFSLFFPETGKSAQVDSSLRFAYSLYLEDDYEYSVLSLKEALFNSRNPDSRNRINLLLGVNYYCLKNNAKAMQSLGNIPAGSDEKTNKDKFLLSFVISDNDKTYDWSLKLCDGIAGLYGPAFYTDTAAMLKIYTLVREGEPVKAISVLDDVRAKKPLSDADYGEINRLIGEIDETGSKSALLAGCLGAVLPGSGYFYCGRIKDGISALTINALLAWGIYSLFDNKSYGSGALLSMIATPFYLGNIVGGINCANVINSTEKELKIGDLIRTLHIGFCFDTAFLSSLWFN